MVDTSPGDEEVFSSTSPTDAERGVARKALWWAEHPNYAKDYRAAHLEQERKRGREREKRRRERKKIAEAKAQRNSERASAYYRRVKAENPERLLEKGRRERLEHPDRIRASARAHYQRNREQLLERNRDYRDATLEQKRELNKRWREANPERVAEYRHALRQNPEAYERVVTQNREARQLKSRLKHLGLPPKQVRHTAAADRRTNLADADEFFARQRIKTQYSPTPRGLLEEWAKFSALARKRFAEHEQVGKYLERHGDRLRAEAVLDSRARELQGKPPLYVEAEVLARARKAVSGVGPVTLDQLGSVGAGADAGPGEALRPAPGSRVVRKPADPNTGPHVAPGTGPSRGPGLS